VPEDAQVEHRVFRTQLVNHEPHEHDRRDAGQGPHRHRREPVLLLSLVEQDLERAHPDRQHADAPVIDATIGRRMYDGSKTNSSIITRASSPTGRLM